MASFIKRGNKVQARVRVRGFPTQVKTFYTRTDAQKWAKSVETAMSLGTWEDPKEVGLLYREALEKYALEAVNRVRNPGSITDFLPRLRRVPFASKRLKDITPADIALLRDQWGREMAPASVLRYLGHIKSLYKAARIDWGLRLADPTKDIRKPSAGRGRERRLADGELDKVLAHATHPQLHHVARLALATAARQGEIAGLQWEHVDLEQRTAWLPMTKNGDSRTLPLNTEAVRVFEAIGPRDSGPVFTISANMVARLWYVAVRKARVAYEADCKAGGVVPNESFLVDLHFHDLRHEAVSRLHEWGFSTTEAAAVSGHRSLQSLKRYSHIRPSHLVKRLAQIEEAQA